MGSICLLSSDATLEHANVVDLGQPIVKSTLGNSLERDIFTLLQVQMAACNVVKKT